MAKFNKVTPIYIGGIAAAIIGFALHLVGLLSTSWSTLEYSNYTEVKFNLGIWHICVETSSAENCTGYDEVLDSVAKPTVLQIFTVLPAIMVIAAVGTALSAIFKNKLPLIPLIACGAAAAACVFVLIDLILYYIFIHAPMGEEEKQIKYGLETPSFGYSPALSLVGGISMGVGAALIFVGKPKKEEASTTARVMQYITG